MYCSSALKFNDWKRKQTLSFPSPFIFILFFSILKDEWLGKQFWETLTSPDCYFFIFFKEVIYFA